MSKEEIKKRCFDVVNTAVGPIEMEDKVKDLIDDLDFVEIVMEAELEFNCSIDEGEARVDDFHTVSDLVDWLADHVAKHPW